MNSTSPLIHNLANLLTLGIPLFECWNTLKELIRRANFKDSSHHAVFSKNYHWKAERLTDSGFNLIPRSSHSSLCDLVTVIKSSCSRNSVCISYLVLGKTENDCSCTVLC